MLAAAARCASGAQARLAGSVRQGRSLFTAVPIARRGRSTAQGVSVACRATQFASLASRHAVATPGAARAFAAEAGQGVGATKREDEIFMATERKVRVGGSLCCDGMSGARPVLRGCWQLRQRRTHRVHSDFTQASLRSCYCSFYYCLLVHYEVSSSSKTVAWRHDSVGLHCHRACRCGTCA
jgi:hypothetical protein